jgi:hypothetical protein
VNVRVEPENEHTAGVSEESVTGNPEVAVTSTTTVLPTVSGSGSGEPKVMVCVCGVGVGVGVGLGVGLGPAVGPGAGCEVGRVGAIRVGCGCGKPSGWRVLVLVGLEAGGSSEGLAEGRVGVHSTSPLDSASVGIAFDSGDKVRPPTTDSLEAALVGATDCRATDPVLPASPAMAPGTTK